jgi:hypothetical protein
MFGREKATVETIAALVAKASAGEDLTKIAESIVAQRGGASILRSIAAACEALESEVELVEVREDLAIGVGAPIGW